MVRDTYKEPLVGRYTNKSMQYLFSDDFKFPTWRKCWTALAEAEHELGLEVIRPEMIDELVAAQQTIDYDVAAEEEARRRHDVMAHVYEYGTHCPTAKGIIHLGATSQFVCCNTDLIGMREAVGLAKIGVVNAIYNLAEIAREHKGLTTLGFTHFQPAQPTTIGKRITMYLQDLMMDLDALDALQFMARGAKGTTGTQASYLKLFDGDYEKVKKLDRLVGEKLGFDTVFPVTGQTYPRKFDTKVAEALAGIGVSLGKFGVDLRLMSNHRIVDEPFGADQIGSSAMAYKRNPMRSERMCSLSRKLLGLPADFYHTAANQWLERTLDDSSIRRMDIPQSFLLADALLILANNITKRDYDPKKTRPMTFYPAMIRRRLNDELQFAATEEVLMDLVGPDGDRQELHEIIRQHSIAAAEAIKEEGKDNDLFERLGSDETFPITEEQLWGYISDVDRFAGAAEVQTEEYLDQVVQPRLDENQDLIGKINAEIKV